MKINTFNWQTFISFLLLPLFFMLLVCNLVFLFYGSISFYLLPVSFIISYVIIFLLTDNKKCYREFSLSIILYILSYILSIFFYDFSSDGQWYHQETIINLKNGWNPVHEIITNNTSARLYIQSYPKGYEYISSVICIFTGKIESGKLINIIALFIACAYVYYSLSLLKIRLWKKIIYTFLICFNPIVITETPTYYLDGFTYLFLISLICSCVLLIQSYTKIKLLNFIAILSIFLSLKFTTLLLTFILSFILVIYLWKNHKFSFKYIFPFLIVGLLIFPITNLNPYYTNIKNNKHIFHPVFGKEKVTNLLSLHTGQDFYNKNRFEKLFISTFSRTGSSKETTNYKLPFTFKISEIGILNYTTIPYGGFGPLFGSIVLLSLLLLILSPDIRKIPSFFWYILTGLILTIIFFPDSWLARMVPHLYLIPIIFILMLDTFSFNKKHQKYAVNFSLAVTLVNTSLFLMVSLGMNLYLSLQKNYQIDQLKKLAAKNITIPVDYFYISNLTTFEENKIPYTIEKIPYSDDDENLHSFGITKGESATRFKATFDENDKPFLLKQLDYFYGKVESGYYPHHKKN